MKRVQLFEFEDFNWFPDWIRVCMTKLIVVMHRVFGTKPVIAQLVAKALQQTQQKRVIDLCSGAGGVMPVVIQHLETEMSFSNLKLILTDLYPNTETIKQFQTNSTVDYLATPVNASDFKSAPEGLKTMINSFHHMPPPIAKKILQSAFAERQAILIYDMGDSQMPVWLWWLFLPLSLIITFVMCLVVTLFVKPLTFKQIFFTYLIPVIPLFFAWDGQASVPRMYSESDMDKLLEGLEADNYSWEKGQVTGEQSFQKGTYLLGLPS